MTLVIIRATKQAARYTDAGGRERCSGCRFFMPQGTCGRIIGPVSPRGWCRFYSQEAVQRWQPQGAQGQGGSPTLDLSFTSGSGVLDSRITFTRASTATYFDSSGVMQTAASGAPRFDYDPVTHVLRGLLIEEQRQNLVAPALPAGPNWTVAAGSLTAAAALAPDGTTAGVFFKEDGTSTGHSMSAPMTGVLVSTQYTISFYAKAAGRSLVYSSGIGMGASSLNPRWNLAAGTDISTGANANFYHGIVNVGNGWYRCWYSWLTANLTAISIQPELSAGGGNAYPGDNVSGFYIWGTQIEAGTFPTSYIATTAAAVTRSAEACSMPVAAWFTAAQGSMMADFDAAGFATCPAGFSDGTTNNMFYFRQVGDVQTAVAGVNKGVTGTPWNTYPTGNKIAGCYQAGRLAGAANGGTVATDNTLAAGPFLWSTRLSLGCSPWGLDSPIDGHLHRVRYWPRVLSNAEMQTVTT